VASAGYQKTRTRQGRRRELSLEELLPLFDNRGRHVEHVADWSAAMEEPRTHADLRAALDSAIDTLTENYGPSSSQA
jgi:hypothetical protein